MRRRRVVAVAGVLAVAALLAGCAADRTDAIDRAELVFDGLVAAAAALDAETLRTVEVGEITEQACGDDPDVVTVGFTATATAPVTATGLVIDQVADDLIDSLDPELWLPIAASEGVDQRAVRDEAGTIATVTTDTRMLVIAVFAPCGPATG
jgi:hypothetical protein